jgi:hypothetical protein
LLLGLLLVSTPPLLFTADALILLYGEIFSSFVECLAEYQTGSLLLLNGSCCTELALAPVAIKATEDKLNPRYVSGFCDGEGSFSVSIHKNKELKTG